MQLYFIRLYRAYKLILAVLCSITLTFYRQMLRLISSLQQMLNTYFLTNDTPKEMFVELSRLPKHRRGLLAFYLLDRLCPFCTNTRTYGSLLSIGPAHLPQALDD